MAKSKGTDPKKETEARIKRTEAYAEKVRLLFAQTVNDILALNKTMPELDDGVMFSFDGESMKKQKEVEALLRRLHSAVTLAIREGVDVEWSKANAEADRLIKSVFGQKVLDSPEFTAWTQRNTAARDAFLARSEKGLNLSDRVWKSVNQLRDEMEVAITVSVGEGKSASAMSREVRQYLNDPDLMFRRFRYKKGEDDGGNPIYGRKWKKRVKDEATGQYRWIDYDRDSYPTGQGVYKSSAKNAMRLTRTETNMAYRRADHERWMQMDFVIGQRIQTAHDHKEKDICDKLKGDYPKDFVFDGWHPQCFCFATPILLDDRYTDSMEDMFLRGEDWEGYIRKRAEEHSIRELPDSFKRWVSENGEKIAASRKRGTEPYFLRENRAAVDGILGKKQSVKVEDTIVGKDAAGNPITHEEWYGTPTSGKDTGRNKIKESSDIEKSDIHKSDIKPPRIDTYIKESDFVYVSELHNEAERKENINMATFLGNKTGVMVFILPHIQPTMKDAVKMRKEYLPDGVKENKNPDFYYKGRFVDGKNMTSIEIDPDNMKAVKRKIQNRISDAFEQADDAFIEIPMSIPVEIVRDAVKGKLASSKNQHIVYVKYGDELLVFGEK